MPFIVNEGCGFVCTHCRLVFPNRGPQWACDAFAEWGRDLCTTCCQTRYACRRLRGWVANEKLHYAREEAFADSVWAVEPVGGYDCRHPHPD
jgi:hypothetical protein